MKVLFSIYPTYIEEIFKGTKKFEFRRKIFKNKDVDAIIMLSLIHI